MNELQLAQLTALAVDRPRLRRFKRSVLVAQFRAQSGVSDR